MKRGDVWWVNFEPAAGGEVRKERPAVIVSNDAAQQASQQAAGRPFDHRRGPALPERGRCDRGGKAAQGDG